jgi:hypothetical protein
VRRRADYATEPDVLAGGLAEVRRCTCSRISSCLLNGEGFHREIPLEPTVNTAGEDADARYSQTPKQQRPTGARDFIGSCTIQNDVVVTGNSLMMALQFCKR